MLALGGLIAAFPPAPGGFYPPCVVNQFTGLHCPGCGAGRAAGAALSGDLMAALRSNPFLALLVPFLGWVGLKLLGPPLLSNRWATEPVSRRTALLLLASALVFAVLRNLPGLEWLAP
jgi:hypothetical protein